MEEDHLKNKSRYDTINQVFNHLKKIMYTKLLHGENLKSSLISLQHFVHMMTKRMDNALNEFSQYVWQHYVFIFGSSSFFVPKCVWFDDDVIQKMA